MILCRCVGYSVLFTCVFAPALHVSLIKIWFAAQDLVSAAGAEEIAAVMELESISDRIWQIQACSAKTGEGLQEGMEWLVGNCKKG